MTANRFVLIRKLLLKALTLPQEERRAYLDKECAGDSDLRHEVESLLKHDTPSDSFLQVDAAIPLDRDSGHDTDHCRNAPGPLTGQTISHFQMGNLIGRGGMGDVYRAVDTNLDREVALKVLSPHHQTDSEAESRFQNEAQAISSLDHQNIVGIHEFGKTENGIRFTVMPIFSGGSIKDLVATGLLHCDQSLTLAIEIASGLAAAHSAGIVHRDLKPGNIMLAANWTAKIIDFGLAKLTDTNKLTRTGTSFGTVAYMSPEHVQGKPIDERSDIFSFAVTLYEMLVGHLPFEGDCTGVLLVGITSKDPLPLEGSLDEIPAGLGSVIKRALAKNPDDRYQSVSDMLHDLQLIRNGGDLSLLIANQTGAPASFWRPWKIGVGGVVCCAFAALTFWSIFSGPDEAGLFSTGGGRSIVVLPDGNGEFPTIAQAIEAAADGDSILLGDGVFFGDGNRDLDLGAKSLVLASRSDNPLDCIIDCGGSAEEPHRALRIESGSSAQVVLRGLTVTNGWHKDGGGMQIFASNPYITNCRFINNSSNDGGGIFAVEYSVPVITECYFSGNQANSGAGALYFQHSPGILRDSEFHNNFAYWAGGAIHTAHCAPTIENCLFVDNNGRRWGNALSFVGLEALATVTNCTFVGRIGVFSQVHCSYESVTTIRNSLFALDGPTVACFCKVEGRPILEGCNVYNYQGDSWAGCINDQLGTNGNISADPLFCSLADGNFTVQNNSPCLAENNITGQMIGAFGVGCDSGECFEVPGGFATISAALQSASVGDSVRIAVGTWFENDLVFPAGITLLGATGDPEDVIIDGRGQGRVILCDSLETGVRIQDLTINGGVATGDYPANSGGGLACFATSITLDNCIVAGNSAYDGGGVYIAGGNSVQVMRCEFNNNSVQYKGGGLSCRLIDNPIFTENSFKKNQATIEGGGLFLRRTQAHVAACSFIQNEARTGTGVASRLSTTDFSYCLFAGNTPKGDEEKGWGDTASFNTNERSWILNCTFADNETRKNIGVIHSRGGDLRVDNSIVSGNTVGKALVISYLGSIELSCSNLFGNRDGNFVGCAVDLEGEDGNFSSDPMFVDPAAGDYRLQVDSPSANRKGTGCDPTGAF